MYARRGDAWTEHVIVVNEWPSNAVDFEVLP